MWAGAEHPACRSRIGHADARDRRQTAAPPTLVSQQTAEHAALPRCVASASRRDSAGGGAEAGQGRGGRCRRPVAGTGAWRIGDTELEKLQTCLQFV